MALKFFLISGQKFCSLSEYTSSKFTSTSTCAPPLKSRPKLTKSEGAQSYHNWDSKSGF